MSNELILCIWDHLSTPDLIFSFLHLNDRINRLLLTHPKLYKELDARYASLPACRSVFRDVVETPEWRQDLVILKLGHVYRCAQLEMFASEVITSLTNSDLVTGKNRCYNTYQDPFHIFMQRNKDVSQTFPQLTTLDVRQPTPITDECRNTLLHIVAGGSNMHTFKWRSSCQEVHHSHAFFDWLFLLTNGQLQSCQLTTTEKTRGYQLMYQHTISVAYQPHRSLVSLKVNILDLTTLKTLLHYLPVLQCLGNKSSLNS